MIGTDGNDKLRGTDHADTIYGEGGDDLLKGLGGDDVLAGQNGDDTLFGAAGNDYLVGGAGDNILNGGAGIDWADFQDATSGVTVDLRSHTAQLVYGDVHDTLVSIERLYGSAGADHFTGGGVDNLFNGAAGDDVLTGGGGDDVLIGGDGADLLDGGKGVDQLQGGSGDDLYKVDSTADVVSEGWGAGTDTVMSTVSYHLGANVENLELQGSANLDGSGNDLANIIMGNAGDNHLYFASGDTVFGGKGDDTFVMTSMTGGVAEIVDYGGSGKDVFDYSLVDADPTRAGHQNFHELTWGDPFTAPGQYVERAAPGPDGSTDVYMIFHLGGDVPDTTVIVQENYHGGFQI
jgi:Ca2+-binding RTX toxin-like protein